MKHIIKTNELKTMCLGGIPQPFHKNLKGMRFNLWLFEKNNDKKMELPFPEQARNLQHLLG